MRNNEEERDLTVLTFWLTTTNRAAIRFSAFSSDGEMIAFGGDDPAIYIVSFLVVLIRLRPTLHTNLKERSDQIVPRPLRHQKSTGCAPCKQI